jgi:hypothetical protein
VRTPPGSERTALRVVRQAGQVARHRHRLGAQAADVLERARDEAADQRDEQQQVDRREPGGREDVEEPEVVEDRPERGVLGEVVGDGVGARGALGQHGAGERGHGEQEQQDQGRAHARQRAPGVAGEREGASGVARRRGWRAGVPGGGLRQRGGHGAA